MQNVITVSHRKIPLVSTWADEAVGDSSHRCSAQLRSPTVCVRVTKCVRSHGCLALQGWVRLRRLPNPFSPPSTLFTKSQSDCASPSGHVVLIASPAALGRHTHTHTRWKRTRWNVSTDETKHKSWTKKFVDGESELQEYVIA